MSLQLFFHSFGDNGAAHEVVAVKENDGYTMINICPATGRIHRHFFNDLREFVLWHYEDHGYTILYSDYPYEDEVGPVVNQPTYDEVMMAFGYNIARV